MFIVLLCNCPDCFMFYSVWTWSADLIWTYPTVISGVFCRNTVQEDPALSRAAKDYDESMRNQQPLVSSRHTFNLGDDRRRLQQWNQQQEEERQVRYCWTGFEIYDWIWSYTVLLQIYRFLLLLCLNLELYRFVADFYFLLLLLCYFLLLFFALINLNA